MEVRQVLQRARDGKADLVDFTKVLSAYGKTHRWSATLHGLTALDSSTLSADTYTINAAAAACRQWPWTLEVLQGIGKRRLQVDQFSCGVTMSALKRGAKTSIAGDLLAEYWKQSIQLGEQSYNIVISAYADENRWPEAVALLSQLRPSSLEVQDFARTFCVTQQMPWSLGLALVSNGGDEAFRSALQMLSATSQWSLAVAAYQRWKTQKIPSLGHLAALLRSGESWRRSLEELQQDLLGPRDDLVAVLSAAARHGAPATALAARLGGSATVEAYGAVLGRCAVEKNWMLAMGLMEMMRMKTLKPDCLCLSSTMDAGGAIAWQQALTIFDFTTSQIYQEALLSETADLDLLGAVSIQSCASSSPWHCSVQLLRALRHQGLRPPARSHVALVTVVEWHQAMQVLQHAQEQLVHLNNSLLSCLAAKCATWQQTCDLLDLVVSRQVEIYTSYFNACAGACASASRWVQAMGHLQTLALHFLQPDHLSARSLSKGTWLVAMTTARDNTAAVNGAAQAALVAEQWQQCLEVLVKAASNSMELDTVSKYLQMHAQTNKFSELEPWQVSLLQLGVTPTERDLYRAGISLALQPTT